MAEHRPLVLISGRLYELPTGDTIVGGGGVSLSEEDMVYAKQIDFADSTTIYKGEATVGSLTSAAVWRIRKLILASDGDVSETWASGDANFNKIWDNRLSLTYI